MPELKDFKLSVKCLESDEQVIRDAQRRQRECLQNMIPVGSTLSVERGDSIWQDLTVISHSVDGYFRAKSRNGKLHSFWWRDIILESIRWPEDGAQKVYGPRKMYNHE